MYILVGETGQSQAGVNSRYEESLFETYGLDSVE